MGAVGMPCWRTTAWTAGVLVQNRGGAWFTYKEEVTVPVKTCVTFAINLSTVSISFQAVSPWRGVDECAGMAVGMPCWWATAWTHGVGTPIARIPPLRGQSS